MKRILKGIAIIAGITIVGLLIFGWISNEPLPKGKKGTDAEVLAQKMLNAMNYNAYKKTRFLEWT